jgi:hypothetical protein
VRQRAAPIDGGDVALEQWLQADAFDEVIDEGQRAQSLGEQSETTG